MYAQLVSGTYFPTLGVHPVMGRALTDDDDNSEGDHPVAMISYAWWKRGFTSDPAVLNRKIKLGTTTYDIVGIAPPAFFGIKVGEAPDIWVPMSMMKSMPFHWSGYKDNFFQSMYIMGRLKPGVSPEQATANINVLYQQIIRGFPDADLSARNAANLSKAHVVLTPMATGLSSLRHEFSEPLKILMGVTALVLLIACANIANLLLARSTARARELAMPHALGARPLRFVRQLLTESLLLAFVGGLLGVGLASFADRLLLRMISGGAESFASFLFNQESWNTGIRVAGKKITSCLRKDLGVLLAKLSIPLGMLNDCSLFSLLVIQRVCSWKSFSGVHGHGLAV
jgi:hypothetical protein